MDSIFYAICGAVFLLGVVLMVFEGRIMRKPESERSERERRFLALSRKVGTGYSKVGLKVFPILLIVLGAVIALFSIPLWDSLQTLAWIMVAMGVAAAAAGIGLFVFAKKRRGPEFWAKHEAANREADRHGRVRWFGSPRAAIVLGVLFVVGGAAVLALSLISGRGDLLMSGVYPILLLLSGAFCLWAGVRQLQQER
jgi:hypothetical protein